MFISNDKKFNNDYDFTLNEDIYADASTTKYAFGGNFDYLHMFKSYKYGIKGGVNYGDRVEVISGLKAGDEVVTSGQINLTDETPIRKLK